MKLEEISSDESSIKQKHCGSKPKMLAFGIAPLGVISIGIVPMGVICIGVVPMGVIGIGLVAMGALTASIVGMGILSVGFNTMAIWTAGPLSMGFVSLGDGSLQKTHVHHFHSNKDLNNFHPHHPQLFSSRRLAIEEAKRHGCKGVTKISGHWLACSPTELQSRE